MAKQKTYTSSDVQVLTDREHVRIRTPMYIGSVDAISYNTPCFIDENFSVTTIEFIPAALKCVNEILDNSIDEFTHITKKNKVLKIHTKPELGEYSISDNGRGVPIDIHPQVGKYTPEVVFTQLRSGRNFNENSISGVIGTNGVGSSICCYTSKYFAVDIRRDNQHYHQEFTEGALHITPPKIKAITTSATGTSITFQLDPIVFKNVVIPEALIHNRAIEVAFNNPNVLVEYNKHKYQFKKGFEDVISGMSNEYFKFTNGNMEFYIAFDLNEGIDENVFTWVNGTYLFEGGICNTQFINALVDKTIDHLLKDSKRMKCEVTKNDIRQNLTVFGILKLTNPNFDSQAKTRLTGPNLRKDFDELINKDWVLFNKKNKEWFDRVLSRAYERHNKDNNSKAVKDHQKKAACKVPNLTDATSRDRSKCLIIITEGLCMDAQTPIKVLTETGFVNTILQDVQIGDTVLTHTNSLKCITSKTTNVKKHIGINTTLGYYKISEAHQLLVYNKNTQLFEWCVGRLLDINIHQLVRSKLHNFEYIAKINSIVELDDIKWRYKITYNESEDIYCSISHTFIVFNLETSSIEELTPSEIDCNIHCMAIVYRE